MGSCVKNSSPFLLFTAQELRFVSFPYFSECFNREMAETLLRSRGYKTGLFTSPHFNSINERIRINGKPISEEELSATFEKLEKAEETEYLRCGNVV